MSLTRPWTDRAPVTLPGPTGHTGIPTDDEEILAFLNARRLAKDSWILPLISDTSGRICREIEHGYFFPALSELNDQFDLLLLHWDIALAVAVFPREVLAEETLRTFLEQRVTTHCLYGSLVLVASSPAHAVAAILLGLSFTSRVLGKPATTDDLLAVW